MRYMSVAFCWSKVRSGRVGCVGRVVGVGVSVGGCVGVSVSVEWVSG